MISVVPARDPMPAVPVITTFKAMQSAYQQRSTAKKQVGVKQDSSDGGDPAVLTGSKTVSKG